MWTLTRVDKILTPLHILEMYIWCVTISHIAVRVFFWYFIHVCILDIIYWWEDLDVSYIGSRHEVLNIISHCKFSGLGADWRLYLIGTSYFQVTYETHHCRPHLIDQGCCWGVQQCDFWVAEFGNDDSGKLDCVLSSNLLHYCLLDSNKIGCYPGGNDQISRRLFL